MYSVSAIPAFTDNYIWAIQDEAGHTVVVDPGDAAPVEDWLSRHGATLSGILITHHHFDHTGGIAALTASRDIPVYGPDNPQIKGITELQHDGDTLTLADLNLPLTVLAVPGHTQDHLAYYNTDTGMLFCGDTLFHCGCGRLFEGTPEQMHASLNRLAALPGNMRVYCTHEYTLANMAFALAVEPGNVQLQAAHTEAQATRDDQQPTLPSTLAVQRQCNPFLRCDQPAVVTAVQARAPDVDDDIAVFAALRAWKDQF